MNSSSVFAAELLQATSASAEATFIRYSSYSGMGSAYQLKGMMPVITPLTSCLVIIMEGLINMGLTMMKLKEKFLTDGATDVCIATILLKPGTLQCPIHTNHVGMEVHNSFIVSRGLGYNDQGRMPNNIYILRE